jgi:hypothetical protein
MSLTIEHSIHPQHTLNLEVRERELRVERRERKTNGTTFVLLVLESIVRLSIGSAAIVLLRRIVRREFTIGRVWQR